MLALDISTLYQIIGFFIFLFVLTHFLVKPLQKVLEERERRIGGAASEAEGIEASVSKGLVEYDEKLKDATLKAMEDRARMRQEAQAEEQAILEKARNEANATLDKLRDEISENRAGALSRLKEEAGGLAKSITEKVLEKKTLSILLPVILTLVPTMAFASAGGDEHGSSGMGWKILNFILLVIGVYVVWKKKLKGDLEARGDKIKKAMDEARKLKESAEAKEREYNDKLATLSEKVSHVQNELRLEAQAERDRVLREAADAADRLKEQAKLVAEQETQKAKLEIRAEVAAVAVEMAEGMLRRELNDAEQKRLAKEYIDELKVN